MRSPKHQLQVQGDGRLGPAQQTLISTSDWHRSTQSFRSRTAVSDSNYSIHIVIKTIFQRKCQHDQQHIQKNPEMFANGGCSVTTSVAWRLVLVLWFCPLIQGNQTAFINFSLSYITFVSSASQFDYITGSPPHAQ